MFGYSLDEVKVIEWINRSFFIIMITITVLKLYIWFLSKTKLSIIVYLINKLHIRFSIAFIENVSCASPSICHINFSLSKPPRNALVYEPNNAAKYAVSIESF